MKRHSEQVARHFASDWTEYDAQIRQVIPHYDGALSTLRDLVAATCQRTERILEIGTGTGSLSECLLSSFPKAHLTGIEIVPEFVRCAEKKLAKHASRVELVCMDVVDFSMSATYDVVVTSFVFHHLEDAVKRAMYAKVFDSLRQDGLVVNLDFVDSPSPYFGQVFDELRIRAMEAHGVSQERIQREYIEHRKLEIPVPLPVQLEWLREVGYVDTECFWKYLNLAMFGGRQCVTNTA